MVSTPRSVNPDSNLAQLLEGLPRISRWLLPVASILMRGTDSSTVEPRIRTLVVLRMAALDQAPYWSEQVGYATTVGVSEVEAESVRGAWEDLETLSDRERAALQWATSVATNDAKRDPHSFAALEESFNASEIVELTAIAAMCALLDRLVNAFQLDPEDPFNPQYASPVSREVLASWAGSMFEASDAGI